MSVLFNNDFRRWEMFILILLSVGGNAYYSHAQIGSDALDSIKVYRFAALSNSMEGGLNESEGKHQYKVRIGASFSAPLNKNFELKGLGALQYNGDGSAFSIQSIELIHSFHTKWQWKIGNLVTPTTLGRPFPLSIHSMQETKAQSRIIGSRPGLGLSFSPQNDMQIYTSIQHHTANIGALHLGIYYKDFRFGAFVESDRNYFISLALTSDKLRANVNYAAREHLINASFIWNLKNRLDVVTEHQIQRGEYDKALSVFGFRYYLKAMDKFNARSTVFVNYNFDFHLIEAKWVLVFNKE